MNGIRRRRGLRQTPRLGLDGGRDEGSSPESACPQSWPTLAAWGRDGRFAGAACDYLCGFVRVQDRYRCCRRRHPLPCGGRLTRSTSSDDHGKEAPALLYGGTCVKAGPAWDRLIDRSINQSIAARTDSSIRLHRSDLTTSNYVTYGTSKGRPRFVSVACPGVRDDCAADRRTSGPRSFQLLLVLWCCSSA
jgi:hypothetical protein